MLIRSKHVNQKLKALKKICCLIFSQELISKKFTLSLIEVCVFWLQMLVKNIILSVMLENSSQRYIINIFYLHYRKTKDIAIFTIFIIFNNISSYYRVVITSSRIPP